jgi:hypothetical protein
MECRRRSTRPSASSAPTSSTTACACLRHLAENLGAANVSLAIDQMARLDVLISQRTVTGARYSAAVQAEIDTEDFA